ncbi:MAG: exodeoxyribonuclease VII large subunit, partial [Sciscionella sp.]
QGPLRRRGEEVAALRVRARNCVRAALQAHRVELAASTARLATLGPAATLRRGYAVVQRVTAAGGASVLSSSSGVAPGTALRIRLADGAIGAEVTETVPTERNPGG